MSGADPTPSRTPLLASLAVYLDRRMLVILLLGFSSGLPFALSFSTLSVWFAEVGVRKAEIGLFVLVGLPYSWKFLWAPFLDRLPVPWLTRRLGQRRSWALVAQVGLMGSLIWLGSLDPAQELALMAWAAILVVFMAATQDVVIDAYRIEILRDEEQGAGSAMTQYGYRLGMLASGAGALYLTDYMPWSSVYVVEAALLLVGMFTVLFAREPSTQRGAAPAAVAGTVAASAAATAADAPVVEPAAPGGSRAAATAAAATAATATAAAALPARSARWRVVRDAMIVPLTDIMRRPLWLLILAFVVLYRFPDAFLSVMANVFYKEIGFTNAEIASVSKVFGIAATLVGAFLGGLVVHRYRLLKSLLLCGVVQMLSNLMYVLMAARGDDLATFAATIAVENVSYGMTSTAFIAYLSSLCSPGLAGSQYALLSALGLSTRNTLSAAGGWLAEAVGWTWFFIVSTAVAIPGMLILAFFLLAGSSEAAPAERRAARSS